MTRRRVALQVQGLSGATVHAALVGSTSYTFYLLCRRNGQNKKTMEEHFVLQQDTGLLSLDRQTAITTRTQYILLLRVVF